MFRTPTEDPAYNAEYYEREYAQGATTTMPADAELAALKKTNFADTAVDYAYYVGVLHQLGVKPSARIFDFGSSWGYGSYQLAQAGYAVTAFEVAPTRRRYAREKLGVEVVEDMEAAARNGEYFDCFFSAHVLEHVPSPAQCFGYAMRMLKPNGVFVSFTPNGSLAYRSATSEWNKLWGEKHPSLIDDVFMDRSFARSPRVTGSAPVANARIPDGVVASRLDRLVGWELFFAARKLGAAWA